MAPDRGDPRRERCVPVATYSLGWNYGDGFEGDLLDAYEIEPDEECTAFYRALWDAT